MWNIDLKLEELVLSGHDAGVTGFYYDDESRQLFSVDKEANIKSWKMHFIETYGRK